MGGLAAVLGVYRLVCLCVCVCACVRVFSEVVVGGLTAVVIYGLMYMYLYTPLDTYVSIHITSLNSLIYQ